MEHRMILMDADFREVKKLIVARRKNAGVAESLGTPFVPETTEVKILSPAPSLEET